MPGKFVIQRGSTGKFRFNLVATNGQVVLTSEAYNSKAAALNGVRAVKEMAGAAAVDDQTTSGTAVGPAVGKAPAGAGPGAGAAREVSGGACGYYSNVGLFGGPPTVRGCGQAIPPGDARSASPSVSLPPKGSTRAITASDRNGALAMYGPAIVFGGKFPADPNASQPPSGPISVSTKGKTAVTSAASVKNVGAGPFVADAAASTCSASKTGVSASTTITKGVLVTATDANGNPRTTMAVPTRPPANYALKGTVANGDRFRAVFNEQKKSRDGTLTVAALHLYLLGPTAVGDVVVAQSHCRV